MSILVLLYPNISIFKEQNIKSIPDRRIFELQAEICKTLADPNRLMLLHELRGGEKAVGQLVSCLAMPQSSVSRHLAVLRDRGVVLTRRKGTTIYYRLSSPKIGEACDLVREVLESLLSGREALSGALFGPGDKSPSQV